MDFDQTKKIDVEVTENNIVCNEVGHTRKRIRRPLRSSEGKRGWDILDVALVPVTIGVFVSLGFLFAGLFRASTVTETVGQIGNVLASLF